MLLEYVLVGGGDFAIEVASYLKDIHAQSGGEDWRVNAIVSISEPRIEDFERVLGYRPEVYRQVASLTELKKRIFVIGIGDPAVRQRAMDEVDAQEGGFGTIIHPRAYVAATATVGVGSIISPYAFVGPFAQVGRNCALNVGAIVGHDARLGDCTVLSPGADINGHGRTGRAAFLGAGAIINPKVELGSYSKLSAGSVLNKSVGDGFLMHGNPASGRQMIRVP